MAFLQTLKWTADGIQIVADAARLTVLAAQATRALVSKPMKAVTYGTALKAAPEIVNIATKDIRQIAENTRAQAKQLRKLKAMATDESTDKTILIPINNAKVNLSEMIPIANLNLGTNNVDIIKIPKKLEKLLN
jgi:hypothetical protein